ncbi:hypothetical protein Tco_1002791 [Tanacetum coccineum]|uniref:Uncharacterized protein n=1 Tax=Tanacetum coccineum TaxID=301880 RepID=A0ABQ5F8N1_9ASTR
MERFAPQLHESAGGLPKTKLVSHSCSLAGSTSAMKVSNWGDHLHFREVGENVHSLVSLIASNRPILSCTPILNMRRIGDAELLGVVDLIGAQLSTDGLSSSLEKDKLSYPIESCCLTRATFSGGVLYFMAGSSCKG